MSPFLFSILKPILGPTSACLVDVLLGNIDLNEIANLLAVSNRLRISLCLAIRDMQLFNLEKRWGLVEEHTARMELQHRRRSEMKGVEPLPWSLREAMNDPKTCLQATKSLDMQRKAATYLGNDAALELMARKLLAFSDIRDVCELTRPISPARYLC